MSRSAVIVALALAVPIIASERVLAEANSLVGRWTTGDRETCQAPGESDEARITIKPRQIILYEGLRHPVDAEDAARRGSAYRVHVDCTEEGVKRRGEILLALTRRKSFHGEILVRLERDTGVVFTYQRCRD
jgi:hypothetical protein